MKKFVYSILTYGFVSGVLLTTPIIPSLSALPVYAEEPIVISSLFDSNDYSIVIENETLSLGENNIYTENGHIMVPLRIVAEKLGFKVEWDNQNKCITLDNGIVNTNVYLGEDSYYMASSIAIGMSAPSSLGVAPVLKNNTVYVPIEIFDVLYCEKSFSIKDNVITFDIQDSVDENINIDDDIDGIVQIPNPIFEYKTIDEAEKQLPFKAVIPSKVVDGYSVSGVSTISNQILQIIYTNDSENEIWFRVGQGNDDISGDYNVYETVKNIKVGDLDVTIRKSENVSSVIWTNQNLTFSIYADGNLSENEISDIILKIL